MKPVVALSSAGDMGAGVAARLVEHGLQVIISLEGRSDATRLRAKTAGMTVVSEQQIAEADILLSILPPGDAMKYAQKVSAMLIARGGKRLLFADCNAVSPDTACGIAVVIQAGGATFVDGSIVGFPPKPGGTAGPVIFASGAAAPELAILNEYGLNVRVLDSPVGAASAIKMCYGGLTKGLVALGSALILAAERAGTAEALRDELQASQPEMFAWLNRMIPNVYTKSHRWVAEMDEVSAMLGDLPEHLFFSGASGLYRRFAEEPDAVNAEFDMLKAFLKPTQK